MENIQITKDNLIDLGFTDIDPYLSLRVNKDISLQFHYGEEYDHDYITMCVSNDDFDDSLHYSLTHIKTIEQVKSLYNIMTNKILPNISTIEQLGLTDDQVHEIVLEWYRCGMCSDIFQNDKGEDLEEYLEI
jgi:hypothetical protein